MPVKDSGTAIGSKSLESCIVRDCIGQVAKDDETDSMSAQWMSLAKEVEWVKEKTWRERGSFISAHRITRVKA
jgi:hypothetical protein